ncbi:MAG: hypothetical protein AAGJ35_04625, partial [Myxococcota bacterium]
CVDKPKADRCKENYNCDIDKQFCDKCVGACAPLRGACEPCHDSKECGEKAYCVTGSGGKKHCAPTCQAGAFCKSGYTCKKGAEHPDKPGEKLDLCQPASGNCAAPAQCGDDGDCKPNERCNTESKTCVLRCQDDAQCGNGKKCCRGRCVAPCTNNGQCAQGEQCNKGCCLLDGECSSRKDCPLNQYCNPKTGLCTPGCQTKDDCQDPTDSRCVAICERGQCGTDCRCKNRHLRCGPIRFCPKDDNDPKAAKPCRKPTGPVCQRCEKHQDCGCKAGDDCEQICTRVSCQTDEDCKDQKDGKTTCYARKGGFGGACATKRACKTDKDCAAFEICDVDGLCGSNCNNLCLNLGQEGMRCAAGCSYDGANGDPCASGLGCRALMPQDPKGRSCKRSQVSCKTSKDCPKGTPFCGGAGVCNSCSEKELCENPDKRDPTKFICIPTPPSTCFDNQICTNGGF